MRPSAWELLHDGSIAEVTGSVPGEVRLALEILYLRELFPEQGTHFEVCLNGCTALRFTPWDEEPTEDFQDIVSRCIQVVEVRNEEPLIIGCAEGVLELAYEEIQVFLPSGLEVLYDDLAKASEKYWKAFAARSKQLSTKGPHAI
jgi:hypothetical protein